MFEAMRVEEEAEKERVGKLMLHIAANLDAMEDKKARCWDLTASYIHTFLKLDSEIHR